MKALKVADALARHMSKNKDEELKEVKAEESGAAPEAHGKGVSVELCPACHAKIKNSSPESE